MKWLLDDRAYGAALAVLVVLSVASQFTSRALPDTAWMLYAAGRMLDGARLYVDLVEVNPPLIVWLNLIPVGLARATGASPILVYRLLVLLLVLGSAWVCVRLMRAGWREAPAEHRRAMALLCLFVILLLSREDYGEREHLLLALTLPYLLLAWLRAGSVRVSASGAAALGLAAGVGIALKPYFALLWIGVEAYLLVAARVRPLIRPESAAIAAVGFVYLASVPIVSPEYFQIVRTMAGPYYEFLSNSLWFTAFLGDGAAIAIVAALGWIALHRSARTRPLWDVLLVATLALYLSAVLQHKGWRYHFYPSIATGLLLLGLITIDARRPVQAGIARIYLSMAAAVTGGLIAWTALACLLQARDPLNPRYDADPDMAQLAPIVRAHAGNGRAMMLSYSMASTFPLMTYAGVESASRFNALWILGAVYRDRTRAAEPLSYRTGPEMGPLERYLNEAVVDDLERNRPDVVVALRAAPDLPQWGLRRLDHLRYFSRDSSFARLFAEYGFVTEVGQYLVFRRLRPGQVGRPAPQPPPRIVRDPNTLLPKETAPVEGETMFAALAFSAFFILTLVSERRRVEAA
ncbi:MAG TPA: hypothetical protein VEB59_05020 [Gemmatimonadales bacterium]|nr:hypothetical protein [Gemmatimonadales bacterium]